ncbi:Transcriptional antiterminator [Natronincola peptidivorans]|uniref:Transcriptional antiterminator n=2 Tax=Natronincola peptidivorans TaxID=426128 RepID=A0A1I0AX54_9FIRM|nr:Transcriptional antiterminator [Natronincola peptidivorans]
MISSRQKKILEQLIQHQDFFTVEQLAKQYGVSQRTIRHDLLSLESCLKEKEIAFIRHRKHGLKLEGDNLQWQRLQGFLEQKTQYLSPESRLKEMAKLLLKSSEIEFEGLMEEFRISDKTLIGDLAGLKSWFHVKNLKLVREKGKVKINGRELYKREAYLSLIKEEATEEKILDYLLNDKSKDMNVLQLKEWFQPEEMHYLFQVVSELEKTLSIGFSDNGYVALILHMFLSLERLKAKHFVAMDQDLLKELQNSKEFKTVESMVRTRIEPYFNIELPLSEIGYITQHILTAQKDYQKDKEDVECFQLAKKIVMEVEKNYHKPLLMSEQIINSLAMHLKPAIYRVKYDRRICNPLFTQLQKEYGQLLEVVLIITNKILEPIGIEFDQQEASYIAMHIGAGLHQQLPLSNRKVAIVCSSGLGTSNILQRRLLDMYPDVNIVKKCSYKDLKDLTSKEVDIVISTIDIFYNLTIPWIKVSPLLSQEDEEKIKKILGMPEKNDARELEIIHTVNEVIKIIEKNEDIKNRATLSKHLIQFFKGAHSYTENTKPFYGITQLLPEKSIILQAETPSTVEKLISLGTIPLKERELIGLEYEEKLIHMINSPNHHFVISKGILFPHASNETGVWGTGFSLVTFKKPVRLQEISTPIWLMITLAAEDNEKHVEALALLIDALNDEFFLRILKKSHNSKDIYDWFQRREGALL